ncbi:DUF2510 domain-containing protein [Cellulomonas iranensis]|uniref:DUF2510 domain-containing protein n=1 Tax=Cellulomonas iranensis TaxID=76862 RepID=A0ABU0GH84_9CELL|nr:DUF2510 domain-containing protein [Cellulomonas iranensis]MDQ0424284.1 hypothetical protein [Cellulomonas iranensis]
MSTEGPPTGWYPDPAGATDTERRWDGTEWTNDTRPARRPDAASATTAATTTPAIGVSSVDAVQTIDEPRRQVPRRALLIGTAVLAVAAVATVAVVLLNRPSRLEAAFDECGMDERVGARLTDGGKTVILDHEGEDDSPGLDIIEVACFTVALGVPDSINARMDSTRALDGRQDAEFDDITVSWSYHPDTGIDMIFEEP